MEAKMILVMGVISGLAFVLGFAVGVMTRRAVVSKYRKDAAETNQALTATMRACREVLSDAWFRKVVRRARSIAGEIDAKRRDR